MLIKDSKDFNVRIGDETSKKREKVVEEEASRRIEKLIRLVDCDDQRTEINSKKFALSLAHISSFYLDL